MIICIVVNAMLCYASMKDKTNMMGDLCSTLLTTMYQSV